MRKRKAQWKSDAQFNFGSPTKTEVEVVGSGEDARIRLLAQSIEPIDVDFNTPTDYSYDDTEVVVANGKAKIKPTFGDERDWPFTLEGNYIFDDAKIEVIGGVARLKEIPIAPYARWYLDEASGTNAADSSGNGRDGTLVDMEDTDWVAGKLRNCLEFDGVNEYVDCGDIANFERTDAFSLEAWFKTSTSGMIMSKMINNPPWTGYIIYMYPLGKIRFILNGTNVSDLILVDTNNEYDDNSWHHLIVTYDGSSDASGVNVYIDGSLVAVTIDYNTLTTSTLNGVNFNIGARDGGYNYAGLIDEVVIYDVELTSEQVSDRYNGGAGIGAALAPYGWWHLNESSGINVPDLSGNSRDGTTTNMEDPDWVAGKLSNCLRFDGVDEYVNLGDIANFERTDAFSAECWFKSSSATIQAIFGRMGSTAPTRGWTIELNASGNLLCYMINNAGTGNYIYVYIPTTNWADGGWHHLVFTYDGSSSASGIHMYVDGVDRTLTVGTDALSATIQNSHVCTISTLNGAVYSFNGDIDEVVFYDSELAASDVSYRWNGGIGTERMKNPYSVDDPDIHNNIVYAFSSPIVTFTETAMKPAGSEIKYQISSDGGVTWKWWNGAVWVAITGGQTDSWYCANESNLATGVNTNISSLASAGTFKFRIFLHSINGIVRPQLDNIYVAEEFNYPTGSFEISMSNDITPSRVKEWLTATETITKPTNTDIKYQYSIDGGTTYNGTWLTASELQIALRGLSPARDGTDILRIKIQLTTSVDYASPVIDNLNFTCDSGYATSGSYVSAIYSPNDEEVCWGVVGLGIDVPKGTALKVYVRFSSHVLDPSTEYLEVTNGQNLLSYPAERIQWKAEMIGDGIVTPKVEFFELTYTVKLSVQKNSQDILSRVEILLDSIDQHTEPTGPEPTEPEPTEPPKAGFKV